MNMDTPLRETNDEDMLSHKARVMVRKLIKKYHGGFHGPNVEHLSMKETSF